MNNINLETSPQSGEVSVSITIPSPDDIMKDKKEALEEEINAFTETCIQQLRAQYHKTAFKQVYVNAEGIDMIVIEEVIKRFSANGWAIYRSPSYDDVKQLRFSEYEADGK